MTIEAIAPAGRGATDLMPGEASDRPDGLSRRVFGVLIGTGAVGTAAGGSIVSAADVSKILLTAGSQHSLWISFLVPIGTSDLAAQFTDPWGGPAPLALALPRISPRPGSLEDDHA